jgi:SH3-like domain-containing protein
MRGVIRALLAAAALGAGLGAGSAQAAQERPTPSGLPVPRYVSLKFDKVNARSGPGDDHRLLWIYRVRGLPVQVVAETAEWRRICDPEGQLVWVHKRTTDGRRTAMNMQGAPAALRRRPKDASRVVAYLSPRAMASLVRCDEHQWCKVRADDVSGWVKAGELWGTSEAIQCRPGARAAAAGGR